MACASIRPSSLEDALKTSQDKTNFVRLTRLLICGGTTIIRKLFDSIITPAKLANALINSKVRLQQLMRSKKVLTYFQWQILFPLPGVVSVVESKSFDITLLFKLLREICSLIPPATGWDNLPNTTDTSMEADLARIKYYRNTIYAHVNENMELSDGDFKDSWDEIKDALIRIVKSTGSSRSVTDCEKAIDDYLTAPLSEDDERNVEELKWWYFEDLGLKDIISTMEAKLECRLEGIQATLSERGEREDGYTGQ
jgi:hypothetical protein